MSVRAHADIITEDVIGMEDARRDPGQRSGGSPDRDLRRSHENRQASGSAWNCL